jgi:hypothetical protein
MLCAWCPSLAERSRKQLEEAKTKNQRDTLGLLLEGRVTAGQMKQMLDDLAPGYEPTENMHKALETGRPMSSNADNMDFYNSLQMGFAYRYVVSKHGDFKLAKKHNREFPQLRQGKRPTLA